MAPSLGASDRWEVATRKTAAEASASDPAVTPSPGAQYVGDFARGVPTLDVPSDSVGGAGVVSPAPPCSQVSESASTREMPDDRLPASSETSSTAAPEAAACCWRAACSASASIAACTMSSCFASMVRASLSMLCLRFRMYHVAARTGFRTDVSISGGITPC